MASHIHVNLTTALITANVLNEIGQGENGNYLTHRQRNHIATALQAVLWEIERLAQSGDPKDQTELDEIPF